MTQRKSNVKVRTNVQFARNVMIAIIIGHLLGVFLYFILMLKI